MKTNIVIIGAGGFGREIFSFLDRKQYNPVGFIDLRNQLTENLPLAILGDDSFISELTKRQIASAVCIAIGDIRKREEIFSLAQSAGLSLPAIIHSNAIILTKIPILEGTVIYPNVVVMNDCRIGKGVLLNCGVTLGHDVEIGDFSSIGPGAHLAGRVKIGKKVMIGIGASVIENLNIGDEAIVGAGSVVVRDVAKGTTVYGVPARPRNSA